MCRARTYGRSVTAPSTASPCQQSSTTRYSAFTEVKKQQLIPFNSIQFNPLLVKMTYVCLFLISYVSHTTVTSPGIPRPVPEYETEIKAILSVPAVAAVMPAYDHETEWTKQVMCVHLVTATPLPPSVSLFSLALHPSSIPSFLYSR